MRTVVASSPCSVSGAGRSPRRPGGHGLTTDEDAHFTREDGRRTFALSEIMVDQHYTRRGVAQALHDDLLAERPEERATLLVNPANTTARRAYERWSWIKIGTLRPSWPGAGIARRQ